VSRRHERIIVIGAGHNGLTAATRLAQAGRSVTVVEARDTPGGLCAEREFHPGYRVPGTLHDSSTFRYNVAAALRLDEHGLAFVDPPPVFAADSTGSGLLLHRSPDDARSELEALSPHDAAGYRRWRQFLTRIQPFVATLASEAPPPLVGSSGADLRALARRGIGLRRLGRTDMVELLRIAPMCAADWLHEYFESPLLCELLAAPGVIGTFLGPWSAGSAANLLLHECTVHREIVGGPAGLIRALLSTAAAAGVAIRTGCPVERIRLEGGRVSGVTLGDGEEIDAGVVASSCDPRQTFLDLLPPGSLSAGFEASCAAYRMRGTTAKMHLALSGPLDVTGRRGELSSAMRIGGGDIDALERAYDAVKYRRLPDRPHLDLRLPTVTDPDLAPAGHHVASLIVSFVPYALEGGWSLDRRLELERSVLDTLRLQAPNLDDRLVATELLTPVDLEREFNLTGGHLHHGEHALDQLFMMRPVAAAGRYRTPVPGLFLAGSGSHPGGGVTGAPGLLAAESVLAMR